MTHWTDLRLRRIHQRLEALEAALAQEQAEPVQEPVAESTYHPCTFILIDGLKKLKAWDVLAEWDKAREIVDKRFHAALAQQDEPVTEDMKSAVRWAPSSAYWSQRLRELFGPDAREGIDALERRLAEAQQAEPVDVGLLEYRGNSVAFIHQKMTAYQAGIDAAWDAFRAKGLHPDGKTPLANMIAKYTAPPQRQPLTEEEIVEAVREAGLDWHAGWTLDERAPNRFATLARAVERRME